MSRRLLLSVLLTLLFPGFGVGIYYAGVSITFAICTTVALRAFEFMLLHILYPALQWQTAWLLAPTIRLGLEVCLVWVAILAMNLGRLSRRSSPSYLKYALCALVTIAGFRYITEQFQLNPSSSYLVPTASMAPNVKPGDRVLVNHLAYLEGRAVKRGDIVVFVHPNQSEMTLVKRVIAVGDDRLTVSGQQLIINGTPLIYGETVPPQHVEHGILSMTETNMSQKYEILLNPRRPRWGNLAVSKETMVPEGHFFMMGDNRSYSIDSRSFGTIAKTSIHGKVEAILFSIDPDSDDVRWNRILKFFPSDD